MMKIITFILVLALILVNMALSAHGTVRHQKINEINFITFVEGEDWQPEGFDTALILNAVKVDAVPVIDGKGDDPAWSMAESLTVPLTFGQVREATVKVVYTDKEFFLMVSWPDATRDDQHYPWVWNDSLNRYEESPQVEDSLLVSFEAGCEWTPSLLSGYVYDFDGWRWLAARTNPIGQAVDTAGHAQDRPVRSYAQTKHESRNDKPFWNLKFNEFRKNIMTKPWFELDRVYLLQPIAREIYVSYDPDRYRPTNRGIPVFAIQVPAPQPDYNKKTNLVGPKPAYASKPPLPMVPQYKPVKLEGDAGEVAAKGRWADGRWTVEFRRVLVTPAKTATDAMFDRVTQFSLHIFDHTEDVGESSESGRLFIQFSPSGGSEEQ